MKRILLAALASHGHVFPAIGLALELRRLGHEVALVTGPDFAGVIRDAGLHRLPRGGNSGDDGPSFELQGWGTPESTALQVLHLENACADFQPDLLVGGMLTMGPMILADAAQLPLVLMGMAFYPWHGVADPGGEASWAGQRRKLDRARAFLGLPAADRREWPLPLPADRFLVRSVADLEQQPLPPAARFVGACLWEPDVEDPELDDWLGAARASGHPILYVAPSRSFEHRAFWPVVVEALRDEPVRVAASVGRMDGPLGDVPPTWLVRDHLPQARILPHAAGVICGGHSTAVLGALAHGIPPLLVAAGSRSEDLAARCTQQGAACYLSPGELTTAMLRDALRQLLASDTMRQHATRLQQGFAALPGFHAAANACIELP